MRVALVFSGLLLLLGCGGHRPIPQYAGYCSGFRVTDWRSSVELAKNEAFHVCGPMRNVVIVRGPKRDPKLPCW